MSRYVVGKHSEFPEGERLIVKIRDREVGIFRRGSRYFAVLNRCPHLGGPLCEGGLVYDVTSSGPGDVRLDTSKAYVTCPWHNWEFDLETGKSYWDPGRLRSRTMPVEVTCGADLGGIAGVAERVQGPYAVDTFPIVLEDDYVVLNMPEQSKPMVKV